MQKCPKCSQQYENQVKICRRCGAILEAVAEDAGAENSFENGKTAATPSVADAVPPSPTSPATAWCCPKCRQLVPGTFDFCYCGTSRDGILDPEYIQKLCKDAPSETEEGPAAEDPPSGSVVPCPKCGSTKIIPGVRIVDQGQYSGGTLQVVIVGNPEALIFKDCRYGDLTADICAACGHVELRVENSEELYEHYRQAAG
jgi:hypothetical protein